MNNKKSLLQDSLQELENIKNESLELAKEQLINESADLLEKKSAALFEKIIAGDDVEEEEDEEDEEKPSKKEKEEKTDKKKSSKDESLSINEMLNELKDLSDEEGSEEDMDSEEDIDSEEDMDSDEMTDDMEDSDEESQMSLDALRKAAEEQGFKLVQADSEGEEEMDDSEGEEEMDDSEGEEEMDDSDEEEDIEFGDEESEDDEFANVEVDDKVLAKPNDEMLNEGGKLSRSQKQYNKEVDDYKFFIVDLKKKKAVSGWESQSDAKDALSDYDKDPNFKVVAERSLSSMGIENPKANFKNPKKINENNTKMRNSKKQVLKDLRDVSFNKLVEAYYNMDEEDSFVVRENEYMDDEDEMSDYSNIGQLEEMEDEGYGMEDEDVMYEVDMGHDEVDMGHDEDDMDELTDEDINEMLAEMDIEDESVMRGAERASGMNKLQERQWTDKGMRSPAEKVELQQRTKGLNGRIATKHDEEVYDLDEAMFDEDVPSNERGAAYDSQEKNRHFKGHIHSYQKPELEEMFEEMTTEELMEMEAMLQEDGEGDFGDADTSGPSMGKGGVRFEADPRKDFTNEQDLTEVEIEEMLSEMEQEEELEESSSISSQTKVNRGNRGGGSVQGRPERRSGMIAEEDEEDVESLREQLKKLKNENKALNEGFTNKVKSLENKVYDVTISALKAGFVNKFLLEHPLRENEKTEIVYRFANAQTKEQIKETYISLTNEFAKGQTVKDGSMLNESVQNKLGKVHRTDNAIVREKNLINENDESHRFKQLLNYNFGKK